MPQTIFESRTDVVEHVKCSGRAKGLVVSFTSLEYYDLRNPGFGADFLLKKRL